MVVIGRTLSKYDGDWRILRAAIRATPGGVLKLKWREHGAKGTITLRFKDGGLSPR
jgi:hypothetical protein